MKEKQHIDELFKGQLENFEAAPSPEVWAGIQAKMKKEKDDRKVIPLWWKLGGIAAMLALLLTVGNFVWNPFGVTDGTTIVKEDQDKDLPQEDKTSILPDTHTKKDGITSEENVLDGKDETNPEKEKDVLLKDQISNESKQELKAIAVEDPSEGDSQNKDRNTTLKTGPEKDKLSTGIRVKDAVAATSEKNTNNRVEKDKIDVVKKNITDRDPLIKVEPSKEAVNTSVTGVAESANPNKNNRKAETADEKLTDKNDAILKKDPSAGTQKSKAEEGIAVIDPNKEKNTEEEKISEENKKSIFDAIEEDKEDAVAKTEDKDFRNWEVTPNVGPVFYSSLGEGSSIDPSFADNSQSGDVNVSYGVQVSYNINDRLSLRSGLNNVNLGYSTGDLELATGPTAVALSSIDYGGRTQVLTALDRGTLANLPPTGEDGGFGNLNPKSTGGNAELIQNLSYFEVPMELKYALVNKRFGVNMIGGFSTLFLGDNEVSVRDGEFRDVLGEANNLNSVSFSTNVGLGFDYKISKRLKFNIEPMFKYQLNPYTDSSVDFRPYYFGVYSGLSFKF
ncbi:MAG: outer membrane beta-barrel protein [Bacteroidota bacterium]